MSVALLVVRGLLTAVFVLAGVTKLADLRGAREAAVGFGVPASTAGSASVALSVLELAIGGAFVPVGSARFAAVTAGVLLIGLTSVVVFGLARGRRPDCHCFGQVHSAPVGPATLMRNAFLLALAGFVGVGGWRDSGASMTHWVASLSGAAALGVAVTVAFVAIITLQLWVVNQFRERHRDVLERLESIERVARSVGGAATSSRIDRVTAPEAGRRLGSRAPGFDVEDVSGGRVSLRSLLTPGKRVILIFTNARCGSCEAMLADLSFWQREHVSRVTRPRVGRSNPGPGPGSSRTSILGETGGWCDQKARLIVVDADAPANAQAADPDPRDRSRAWRRARRSMPPASTTGNTPDSKPKSSSTSRFSALEQRESRRGAWAQRA